MKFFQSQSRVGVHCSGAGIMPCWEAQPTLSPVSGEDVAFPKRVLFLNPSYKTSACSVTYNYKAPTSPIRLLKMIENIFFPSCITQSILTVVTHSVIFAPAFGCCSVVDRLSVISQASPPIPATFHKAPCFCLWYCTHDFTWFLLILLLPPEFWIVVVKLTVALLIFLSSCFWKIWHMRRDWSYLRLRNTTPSTIRRLSAQLAIGAFLVLYIIGGVLSECNNLMSSFLI